MSNNESAKKVLNAIRKIAIDSSLSVNELRVLVALERIVARIDAYQPLEDKLVFKGGFVLLNAYQSPRFTRDVDALASNISKEVLVLEVMKALAVDLDDGLNFAPPQVADLIDQREYGGYRFIIPFQIGSLPKNEHKIKKLSCIHFDVAFGDQIEITPKRIALNQLTSNENPVSWRVYPLEIIIAEKLQTLVSRNSFNSRAKDLYDIVLIFEQLKSKDKLLASIKKTFTNRETAIPESFLKFLEGLSLTMLENSWKSVDLQGQKMNFAECVEKLKLVLRDLDELSLEN